jgi:PleD family two-component response regulator
MQQAFASANVPGMPTPHGCTFLMGGAAVSADSSSLDRLIEQADERLYLAKADSRIALRVAA